MPLILLSGFPCSGKTTRALEIKGFFEEHIAAADPASRLARLKVHVINDESLGVSRAVYASAKAEKDARAEEYSAVKRVLSQDDVVIADGLNYIKGFRYQLYCEAKAVRTPSCVVHIGTPIPQCRTYHTSLVSQTPSPSTYDLATFDNLVYRYEEPNGMTRWDSPLFTVLHDDASPPMTAIWTALLGPLPSPSTPSTSPSSPSPSDAPIPQAFKTARPNAATVLPTASPQNALQSLDRITSSIIAAVLSYQREHASTGCAGDLVPVPDAESGVQLPVSGPAGVAQLQRIRRTFVAMSRKGGAGAMGAGAGGLREDRIGEVFVGYLNAELER